MKNKYSPEWEDPKEPSFKHHSGNIAFFKVPLQLQTAQAEMTSMEMNVLIAFFIQMSYRDTRWIQIPLSTLSANTGISRKETIIKAIHGLVEDGWIEDIRYQKNDANWYHINIEPTKNEELIKKIQQRKLNTSNAKKKSIAEGEKGKFVKKETTETLDNPPTS